MLQPGTVLSDHLYGQNSSHVQHSLTESPLCVSSSSSTYILSSCSDISQLLSWSAWIYRRNSVKLGMAIIDITVFLVVLLRYYLYVIKCIHFNYTFLWFLVSSQSCSIINTVSFRTFSSPQKKAVPMSSHFPPLPPCMPLYLTIVNTWCKV